MFPVHQLRDDVMTPHLNASQRGNDIISSSGAHAKKKEAVTNHHHHKLQLNGGIYTAHNSGNCSHADVHDYLCVKGKLPLSVLGYATNAMVKSSYL